MKRKILIVSGTRADYGLLKKLTMLFQVDESFETYFAATGTHLSEKHGKTINSILEDNIKNVIEVDIQIEGDQPENITHSLTVGIERFSSIYKTLKPEFIIVLGDRYELWCACIPASLFSIPIVHIHGGESTQGVVDEAVRHSLTKMSHLHLCSHEDYRQRIIRMGENPDRVHVVGAVGLDRIKEMNFLSRSELEKNLGIHFNKKNILCTFHPVTLDAVESHKEVTALMEALEEILEQEEVHLFITFPNSDTYSSAIQQKWDELIRKYPTKVKGFTNLGDLRYLSMMNTVDLIIGNSSSGIIEAPFLKKAVVDIGMRQEGRLRSKHIIHCEGTKDEIKAAATKALSSDFQSCLETVPSIYGDGHSVHKIYDLIKKTNFKNIIFKVFYDGEGRQ